MVPMSVLASSFGQIELDRDALPPRIGMRRDQIAGDVAGENRDRIHTDIGEVRAEAFRQPGRQTADEGLLDRLGAERAADHVPQRAFFRGRLRMYSGNRSSFTRVWVPSVRSWPLLR